MQSNSWVQKCLRRSAPLTSKGSSSEATTDELETLTSNDFLDVLRIISLKGKAKLWRCLNAEEQHALSSSCQSGLALRKDVAFVATRLVLRELCIEEEALQALQAARQYKTLSHFELHCPVTLPVASELRTVLNTLPSGHAAPSTPLHLKVNFSTDQEGPVDALMVVLSAVEQRAGDTGVLDLTCGVPSDGTYFFNGKLTCLDNPCAMVLVRALAGMTRLTTLRLCGLHMERSSATALAQVLRTNLPELRHVAIRGLRAPVKPAAATNTKDVLQALCTRSSLESLGLEGMAFSDDCFSDSMFDNMKCLRELKLCDVVCFMEPPGSTGPDGASQLLEAITNHAEAARKDAAGTTANGAAQSRGLSSLSLRGLFLQGPELKGMLSAMPGLLVLGLSGCRLVDEDMQGVVEGLIHSGARLTSLDLGENWGMGPLVDLLHQESMKGLTSLTLDACDDTHRLYGSAFIEAMQGLNKLQELSLSETSMTPSFAKAIMGTFTPATHPNLARLDMTGLFSDYEDSERRLKIIQCKWRAAWPEAAGRPELICQPIDD